VDALMAALRTHRDRAMVAAMVLGGLRRCEVLGLRPGGLHIAERRVFIAEGKGGRQRLIPVSGRFFAAVAAYLDTERPPGTGSDRSSWCSRGRGAACRCRPRGWKRFLWPHGGGLGWSMRPAMSCGIPA
jgi:site-specific recombinase XerC